MSSEFLTEVHRYMELQTLLVSEFRKAYPGVKDFQHLLDAPETGCLETARGLWLFRKHGAGFSFVNAQGVWVDVHRRFGDPELFDTWRLKLYLESTGNADYDLEAELSMLVSEGKLLQEPDKYYRLESLPPVVTFECGVQELRPESPTRNEREALIKLVANALYEIRLRLGPGRGAELSPNVEVSARLAYALHNEALNLLGEPYKVSVAAALERIASIDQDFEGENLLQSFQRVLASLPKSQ